MHFKFEYNTSEIRSIVISVVNDMRILYREVSERDFFDDVSENTKIVLKQLDDDSVSQLHLAAANASDEVDESGGSLVDCAFCGEIGTAVAKDNGETYCFFCAETDSKVECSRCTEMYKMSEMEYFGDAENGDPLYLCGYCSDLFNEND
jgi:hypothetical protein